MEEQMSNFLKWEKRRDAWTAVALIQQKSVSKSGTHKNLTILDLDDERGYR